ncbi:MAG: transglycosylase [Rhodanobacter sp. 68-29]|uniref:GlsB/YeaQ/YmgE family stress response membrane protein n=1 Tax=Rhodanobacter sp. PCA2 TaxID=2006117 RepID=UPI00086F4A08|nr:GlsB/YeaQ/YmgE family stress response membrane protein [Rhodanobacter sp. PCA2]MBA2078083.1 GlsB/YeaQ/YmgE family stress response membrane protein [Rhodanobacter sp. PCA2]MBN8922898.1 GlsB/YeaQ/YmgE family stress response membrane protein [Rhodanobacter sp.]ODU72920.1 MAG: transglycosylase [Rhodanobacter sp. SCN 69-32]OJY62054.1 MAG: transglycosylase [Rhodanobacter sp. 68-29]
MHWLWVIIIGLIVGVIAKFIRGGQDSMGFIITVIIGILGSVIATYVGEMLHLWGPTGLVHFLASIGGAVILLAIYHVLFKPSSSS